jgi:glycosyltransferase involved in cell wall biosynthesis
MADDASVDLAMKPLRFCMITTFYPPYNFGGDGIFVHRLSNELAGRGHHVEVIHCIDAYHLLARQEPAKSYENRPNVTVHGLKSPFGFFSPLATQQAGYPFFKSTRIKQILEKGFDVIHYHNISLIGGPKILEYGSGIKLYTMHEYWLICPTHVLFRFNRAACSQPHCFTCALTYKRPPQWWRQGTMMRSALQHVDAFIAPSRFTKEIHHRMGLDGRIVHLPHFIPGVGNGAVLPLRRPRCEPEHKPYFLFVGRLERIKGLQTLIPVFRRYEKAQLWIAGDGGYASQLRQLAGGSDNVRFLGYRTKDELQELYWNATAVIVPSLSFEVFALVIIEAFSQQTPVVARNIGGMPEIIQESGGGLTYDSDQELLTAMDQLVADSSYRDHLGASGHKALEQKWSADAHLQSYFALIDEIATSRGDWSKKTEPTFVA